MKFSFLDNLALYVLEGQPTPILPDIAMQGLEDDYDSESLILIAGCPSNENPFVIDVHFKSLLKELGLHLAEKSQAALFLIKSIRKKIVDNEIDPYEGCDLIFKEVVGSVKITPDKIYAHDGIGLAQVYGMYDNIRDLMEATGRWDTEKTKEELIEEVKERIRLCFIAYEFPDRLGQ